MMETSTPIEKQAKTNQAKPVRPSRRELIERNANPTSRLAGSQKTFSIPVQFHSDILFNFMQTNQATMLSAYERLAALKRMLSRDAALLEQVDKWLATNKAILNAHIEQLAQKRGELTAGKLIGDLTVNIPSNYETVFVASHPVAHKMVEVIELVDEELNQCEQVYFAGLMSDTDYANMRNDAIVAIRGTTDRIFKVTTPGNRVGGRYNAKALADWMRQGNKLDFADFPQLAKDIVTKHRKNI